MSVYEVKKKNGFDVRIIALSMDVQPYGVIFVGRNGKQTAYIADVESVRVLENKND